MRTIVMTREMMRLRIMTMIMNICKPMRMMVMRVMMTLRVIMVVVVVVLMMRLSSLLREYLKNGGCCTNNCLIKYKELATKHAYAMFHLKKATKKAVVLGMLAMIHVVSECSRRSFKYCLDKSSHICKVAFCAVTVSKLKSCKNPFQKVM